MRRRSATLTLTLTLTLIELSFEAEECHGFKGHKAKDRLEGDALFEAYAERLEALFEPR